MDGATAAALAAVRTPRGEGQEGKRRPPPRRPPLTFLLPILEDAGQDSLGLAAAGAIAAGGRGASAAFFLVALFFFSDLWAYISQPTFQLYSSSATSSPREHRERES